MRLGKSLNCTLGLFWTVQPHSVPKMAKSLNQRAQNPEPCPDSVETWNLFPREPCSTKEPTKESREGSLLYNPTNWYWPWRKEESQHNWYWSWRKEESKHNTVLLTPNLLSWSRIPWSEGNCKVNYSKGECTTSILTPSEIIQKLDQCHFCPIPRHESWLEGSK